MSFLKKLSELPEFRNELVLHGGTALHLIYGSPRLSDDLDFVLRDVSYDFNQLSQLAEKSLNLEKISMNLQKDEDNFKRIKNHLQKEGGMLNPS